MPAGDPGLPAGNTPSLENYPTYIYNLNANVETITTKVSVKNALYKITARVKVMFSQSEWATYNKYVGIKF